MREEVARLMRITYAGLNTAPNRFLSWASCPGDSGDS